MDRGGVGEPQRLDYEAVLELCVVDRAMRPGVSKGDTASICVVMSIVRKVKQCSSLHVQVSSCLHVVTALAALELPPWQTA